MVFRGSKNLRKNILTHLEQVSDVPKSSDFKFRAHDAYSPVDALNDLHFGTERPTIEQLVELVSDGQLHASAKPEVLGWASGGLLRSRKKGPLVGDCRNVLLALSHSPQTRSELADLFANLDDNREPIAHYMRRVTSALNALTELSPVIRLGHASMLSWRNLVPEKLPPLTRARVQAFQDREAEADERARILRQFRT